MQSNSTTAKICSRPELLNISHGKFEYLRLNDFTPDSREGRRRLFGTSRAKYLVPVRKLQEEEERFEKLGQISKLDEKVFACNHIPFFHPGACSNKYFTRIEHASRKCSAEIKPNRYGGKCSRPFKYLKKHGRLKFVLPPGKSQIFAKPVMNICIEDLCKFVYVNMRERERKREKKEFERKFVTNWSVLRIEIFISVYFSYLTILRASFDRFARDRR